MSKKEKILYIAIFGIAISGIYFLGYCSAHAQSSNTTEISVFNPFRISIKLEVKCDHDYKTQKYKFYRIIDLPGKGNYKLIVPNNMKSCEVWPLKIKLFR